jgi:hypothetical protein
MTDALTTFLKPPKDRKLTDAQRREREKVQNQERGARYRERQKSHHGWCGIDYPAETVDMLVDYEWLPVGKMHDQKAIAAAIEAWLFATVAKYAESKRR